MVCLGPNCKKSAGRDNFCSKSCEAEYAAINSPKVAINTQPAINEERLTDAINAPTSKRGVEPTSILPLQVVRESVPDAQAPSLLPRTPNRRSREAYNAYMRGYMKAYRGRRGS